MTEAAARSASSSVTSSSTVWLTAVAGLVTMTSFVSGSRKLPTPAAATMLLLCRWLMSMSRVGTSASELPSISTPLDVSMLLSALSPTCSAKVGLSSDASSIKLCTVALSSSLWARATAVTSVPTSCPASHVAMSLLTASSACSSSTGVSAAGASSIRTSVSSSLTCSG